MAAVEGVEGGERKEEDEEEVEEQLVMVELSGIIDSDFLEKCENKCKILGIETERPILQVDRYVFAGEYEDALGTCVVFEENTEHGNCYDLMSCLLWQPVKLKNNFILFQLIVEFAIMIGLWVLFFSPLFIVDAEGNQKVQLKYKCHTMKKLNMTRTLLTEKKEGEENVDGVEWLQIKDRDFSYSRPNMICSFLHEKEDSDESAQAQDKLAEESEGEVSDKGNSDTNCDQAQDKPAEESEGEVSDKGNSDTNCDLEKQHGLEVDASPLPLPHSPAPEAEGSPSGSVALDDTPP
ncbi:general transcription factor 3C polypeptide 6 isoform X4 [Cygnus atratus]|uniref:general transcription factor 3C polypeptide 6 isoform X4 n=1 Tax=Cygnus atratus TaxID=8868 RepID=UPI0015D61F6D|nr:general transcription factor 3C polypeptide 6 isoform X4 [Cygnus atratus]